MKLLIVTQAVDLDDPVLGFFHRWLEEFSKHNEHVSVVCLKEGRHTLPANVSVYSLGKDGGVSRAAYILNFYRYIWKLRNDYDAVFVHMNPEYVVLGGFLWRLLRKRIVLWYVHRGISFTLRAGVFFAHAVVTTARESIGIKDPKITIVGHGIDVVRFAAGGLKTVDPSTPRIVAVGRVTPIKDLSTIIRAVARLQEQGVAASLDIIGSPTVSSDRAYEKSLGELVDDLGLRGVVSFRGSVTNTEIAERYAQYDLSVNACPTGGIDKAVLESMAAGVPVLVANGAFRSYLEELAAELTFAHGNADDLAHKARALLTRADIARVQERERALARAKADVGAVIPAIMKQLYAPGR